MGITTALLKNKIEDAAQPTSSVETSLKPRYCHLVKDRTFGFHLTNDQNCDRPGQYVRQVAEGGVADVAGVKEGDRIVEINSTNIEDKTHKDVVAMIVASGKEVNFLVVDEETDVHYKKQKVAITMSLLTAAVMTPPVEDDKQSVASEKPSVTESVHSVEVHAEPEPEAEKPEIVVDEPAEDKEDDEEGHLQAVAALKQVIDENQEEDEVGEAVEELKEEIQEKIEEELEDKVGEEAAEEIAEKLAEEVVEDIVEEAKEEAAEEVLEEMREEAAEEVLEEMREEIAEEVREEIAEEIKEEIKEEIREEIREEIIEDVIENAYEEVVETREEPRETEEEMRERMREEMKEKMREAVEELREEIQEKIEEE